MEEHEFVITAKYLRADNLTDSFNELKRMMNAGSWRLIAVLRKREEVILILMENKYISLSQDRRW